MQQGDLKEANQAKRERLAGEGMARITCPAAHLSIEERTAPMARFKERFNLFFIGQPYARQVCWIQIGNQKRFCPISAYGSASFSFPFVSSLRLFP
jgi:hypothetical protein